MRRNLILLMISIVIFTGCGKQTEKQNKWTDINEAMSHTTVQTEITDTTDDSSVTTTTIPQTTQNQKEISQSIVTNLTTETTTIPNLNTSSVLVSETSSAVQSNIQFYSVNPNNYCSYEIPANWNYQTENNEIVLQSSNENYIYLDLFSYSVSNYTDDEIVNAFLNNISNSFSIGNVQFYSSWYVVPLENNNGTYNLYITKFQDMLLTVMATQSTSQDDVDSFISSLAVK